MYYGDSDDDYEPDDYTYYDDIEEDDYSYRSCLRDDKLKQMNRCLEICAKLNEDRKEGTLCDATLVVQGQKFSVHKNVLKASSSYFSAMFVGSFTEKSEEEIEILGVSPEVFAVVLDYVYGAAIKLTFENVKDIYIAGDMLCIDSLIADCKSYIKSNWEMAKDIQAVYEMANQFEMNDITADIVTQVRLSFSISLVCSSNFKELSHSILLIALDGRNSIDQLKNESCIVKNLLQWAIHKPNERIPDLVLKVLSVVHFELIAEDRFMEILDFNSIPESTGSTAILKQIGGSLETLYRHSHRNIIDFGFRLVFCGMTSAQVFVCETWNWEIVTSDLTRRPRSYVLSDNDLYSITNDGCTKLDLINRSNVTLPNFPERRIRSTFSVLNKTVYVTGGTKEGTNVPLGQMLSLTPPSINWKTGITWGNSKSDASSITHGQNIYLVGGSNDYEGHTFSAHSECSVYNTSTRDFKTLCILPVFMRKPYLVIHEGVLYIFFNPVGGYSAKPHVEAVDLKHQKIVTNDIKALDVPYLIISVCSVASGIVIAYALEDTFLFSLYRPTGNSPSELLGVVSSPEAYQYQYQYQYEYQCNKLFFHVPK